MYILLDAVETGGGARLRQMTDPCAILHFDEWRARISQRGTDAEESRICLQEVKLGNATKGLLRAAQRKQAEEEGGRGRRRK